MSVREIKLDKLNPYHELEKRGKRMIWINMDEGQIVLELSKDSVYVFDYARPNSKTLYWKKGENIYVRKRKEVKNDNKRV